MAEETIHKPIDHEEAIKLAREYLLRQLNGYAYPVVPTDDDGNQEPYEPGCVPWVVLVDIKITDAFIEDPELDEDGDLTVRVDATLIWEGEEEESESEDAEVEAIYAVVVGYDKEGDLVCWDYERVD
jgi:hypothetical protein